MARSVSTSRGGNRRNDGSVSSDKKSSMSGIIVGKDITPKSEIPYTFIGLVCLVVAMVVMYFMEIYNCNPWLFGVAVAIAWCNVPKKVEKKYRYDFEVSVGSNSYKLYGVSSLPTINVADIGATFGIDKDQNGWVTDVIYRIEIPKVILTGALTGFCLLSLECFNNTNGYNNQETKYKIKDKINIVSACGTFQDIIRKENVPEISSFCAPLRD